MPASVAYLDSTMYGHQAQSELWTQDGVRCVVVASGQRVDIELRNQSGTPFLRKNAPSAQAALNEAEYLRLLMCARRRAPAATGLKPFALVVEDEAEVTDRLAEGLRACGMRAFGCLADQAAALARELVPDVIVLDSRRPDGRALDACRELRRSPSTASVPIVAVSTCPEALRTQPSGPDAVLTRPCDIDMLLAATRLFLVPRP